MVDPRCARLRLPPGAEAPTAPTSPAGLPAPHSPLRQGLREPGREEAPATADLAAERPERPRFRGEGDSDGSVGQKMECRSAGGSGGLVRGTLPGQVPPLELSSVDAAWTRVAWTWDTCAAVALIRMDGNGGQMILACFPSETTCPSLR
ncbi:uncharacterized protein [Manis javanica]|uniref:uncharacterized protein isoform X2 n=1 Tax=Manis javanica TaxID=9974 RepID=UPI003C6D19B6